MIRLVLAATLACAACGGPDASTLTHPPRKSSFPLYVTVPGSAPGTGTIYKIDAPGSLDVPSEPVAILTGLDFPAAVAVDRDGTVYYTDRASPTTGRIMKYLGEGIPPELVKGGLADPQGLAIDRAGKLYVAQTGANAIHWVDGEELIEIKTGLSGPRSISTDENDNLYVTEAGAGKVTKLIPDGTTENLASALVNPVAAGPGLVHNLFYLVGNAGLGDGQAVKLDAEGKGAETYLKGLVNPRSFDFEDSTILYIAEGAPAFRVIKYSRVTNIRTETASLPGDPHTIAFTPIN